MKEEFYSYYENYRIMKRKINRIVRWGLGIGDWGLGMGIGDWAQSPIPNPQSPIPNPQNSSFMIIQI